MVLVAVAFTGAVVSPAQPVAAAPINPRIEVSLASHPDNSLFRGTSVHLDSDAGQIGETTLSPTYISVEGAFAPAGTDFTLRLQAKGDVPFRIGNYGSLAAVGPGRTRISTAGSTDVGGDGRGCFNTTSFRILDLAVADGRISRLHLLFVDACDNDLGEPVFGELRVGEPASAPTHLSVQDIDWPVTAPRTKAPAYPVTVTNTSSAAYPVTNGKVIGRDHQAFSIVSGDCADRNLEPGQSCTVLVAFTPLREGDALATLDLFGAGEVHLEGRTPDGETAFDVTGSAHDTLARGARYRYVPSITALNLAGSRYAVSVRGGYNWNLTVGSPNGTPLHPGTYATRRTATKPGELSLDLGGDGRGCNDSEGSVTFRQLEADPMDGSLFRADLSYRVRCTGSTPWVTGQVRYNADAAVPDDLRIAGPNLRTTTYGKTVTVIGVSAPNAVVNLALRRRGASSSTHRTIRAGTDGHFRATFRALDDYAYRASAPGVPTTPTTVTRISPTITGDSSRTARSGRLVTIAGTANPHRGLRLAIHRVTPDPADGVKIVHVGRDGHWRTSFTVRGVYRLSAISAGSRTTSKIVTVRPVS